MDAIVTADRLHETNMQDASRALLTAMRKARFFTEHKPDTEADLVWRAGTPQNQWAKTGGEYADWRDERSHRVLAALAEKDRIAEQRRVSRDPCPLCAVRADIGCRHRRAA
jgi:hypothetical protein